MGTKHLDMVLGEDDKHLPSMSNAELLRVDKLRVAKIKSPDTKKMMAVAIGDERNTVYYTDNPERYKKLIKIRRKTNRSLVGWM